MSETSGAPTAFASASRLSLSLSLSLSDTQHSHSELLSAQTQRAVSLKQSICACMFVATLPAPYWE
jgi:hypothetical protein